MPVWNAESMQKHAGVRFPLVPLKHYVDKKILRDKRAAVVKRKKGDYPQFEKFVFTSQKQSWIWIATFPNRILVKPGRRRVISPHASKIELVQND